jgi:hypothetical protein
VSRSRKILALAFAGTVLLAVLLLTAGMGNIRFETGRSFSLPQSSLYTGPMVSSFPGAGLILQCVRVTFLLALLALPFYIVYLIRSPEARKRLLRSLLFLLPFAFLFYLATRSDFSGILEGLEGLGQAAGPLAEGNETAPLAEFTATPADWVVIAIGVLMALLLTFIIARAWLNRQRDAAAVSRMERLATQAEDAAEAIYAGDNLKEAIIRIYQQMSEILLEERGIRRDRSVTPHEFQGLLAERGLPPAPVQQLTELFEQVRYGQSNPGREAEQRAIDSLNAIARACRGAD